MGEFVAAKRRFVVHLRTEDLHEALAGAEPNGHVPVDALADALGQLVEWGNLRADPDTSRVTTVEDVEDGEVASLLSIVARRDAEDAAPGGGAGTGRANSWTVSAFWLG